MILGGILFFINNYLNEFYSREFSAVKVTHSQNPLREARCVMPFPLFPWQDSLMEEVQFRHLCSEKHQRMIQIHPESFCRMQQKRSTNSNISIGYKTYLPIFLKNRLLPLLFKQQLSQIQRFLIGLSSNHTHREESAAVKGPAESEVPQTNGCTSLAAFNQQQTLGWFYTHTHRLLLL